MPRLLVQNMALWCALFVGPGHARQAYDRMGHNTSVGTFEPTKRRMGFGFSALPDTSKAWQDPAYWGLKKGEPIPHPGGHIGSWPGKKWAYETWETITYL